MPPLLKLTAGFYERLPSRYLVEASCVFGKRSIRGRQSGTAAEEVVDDEAEQPPPPPRPGVQIVFYCHCPVGGCNYATCESPKKDSRNGVRIAGVESRALD